MQQLIQLRWIAVLGQIGTITWVSLFHEIALPLERMLTVLVCLVAFNLGSQLRWHEHPKVTNKAVFLALLVDVASLTAQLYWTGGTANPFAFLYLLQVILGAVLLDVWSTWTIVAITSACLTGLALYAPPLRTQSQIGLSQNLYIEGMLVCFALNAALLVFFITRINRNLRSGDALLASMRQRAVEEEHIVRMGLLASGAAHELGTPLATLAVILGDWRRMPEFVNRTDLREDLDEMQTQLQRCKSIVSGILMSAGEMRGESAVRTTLNTFLDDLARDWRATRAVVSFAYHNRIDLDRPVVFDSALKQMIDNVLDNALDASPDWVEMEARCDNDVLTLMVTDAGPGFAPAMLSDFGKPYQSSKGRAGGGLGLFLSVNVARTLGGAVTARNRDEGGAAVLITLPLAAIMITKAPAYAT
jgi:two-component system sensor histidine kinase RegB